jgi:uncharacterized protein DUF3175
MATRTKSTRTKSRRWVRNVKTVSTYPPEGLFTRDARTIARVMASKRVSPKGIGSAIRMVQFFINRGGKGLPQSGRRRLEAAKRILQRKRDAGKSARPSRRSRRKPAGPKTSRRKTARR